MNSIYKLHEAITKATKYLKKMPGSHFDDCSVRADESSICYHRTKNVIWVEFDDKERFNIPILQLPDEELVSIASYIPDLIILAKEFEPKVRNLAEEAAASIEEAIEATCEYY